MPRSGRANDLVILGAALAVIVGLTVASFVLSPPASAVDRASTYSSRRDGAKAAYLLLKERGYDVERSFEPLATLFNDVLFSDTPFSDAPSTDAPIADAESRNAKSERSPSGGAGARARLDPARTVLVLASPTRHASQQDERALRRFIQAGGVVLATGDGGDFLPNAPSTSSLRPNVPPPQRYEREADASPLLTRRAPAVRIAPEVVKGWEAVGYATLYRANREAGVVAAQIGRGQAIWWIGSTPLLNGSIEEPGHVELLLNVVGPPRDRLVLWDEYYHGRGRSFGSYLAGTPLPAALAQVALMAVLALFTFTRRRGPIRAIVDEPRASSMEFVEAMGALYEKARATSGAVEIGRARLRRLLIAATQMPAGSADDQIARAAAVRYPVDERELRDLLAASAEAESTTLAPGRALALTQALQAVAARLLARGPGPHAG